MTYEPNADGDPIVTARNLARYHAAEDGATRQPDCPADRAHGIPEHVRGSMPERCAQCAIAWANSRDPYSEAPVPPWAQRFGLPRPGYSRTFTSGAGNRYRVRGPLVRVTWANPAWRPTTLTFDNHRQAVAYARLHGREVR